MTFKVRLLEESTGTGSPV